MESIQTLDARLQTSSNDHWLRSQSWDLTWVILSSCAVVLPFLAYELFTYLLSFASIRNFLGVHPRDVLDVSRNTVNGIIALLIGGPHMYATYTRTFLDGGYRREHTRMLAASLLIPCFVIFSGIFYFQFLVTIFFFAASLHVMEQAGYVVGCYAEKSGKRASNYSRYLEYIVVFSSLYPIAMWRMVDGTFRIGQIELLIPRFILLEHNPFIGYSLVTVVSVIFAASYTLWLLKSYAEYKSGSLNIPKFLFVFLTATITFIIPAYHELDVAFQGLNTWHSIQYLGLTWYVNVARKKRDGALKNSIVDRISDEQKGWKFYFFNVGIAASTVALVGVMLFTRSYTGFTFDQAYYIVILSVLLMHYLHDHYLFKEYHAVVPSQS